MTQTNKPEANLFAVMMQEHRELIGTLNSIRKGLVQTRTNRQEVSDLLRKLCFSAESHFDHEEDGGYLSEATDRAPWLMDRANQLCAQHRSFRDQLATLRTLAEGGTEEDATWQEFGECFESFRKELLRHESLEDELVQEAFTQDLGIGD